MQRFVRAMAVALVGGVLAAGCGGGDEDAGHASTGAANQSKPGDKPTPGAAPTVKIEDPAEAHLATAVADTKTMAPIDLLYDLPAKPEIGQPFALELVVKPRMLADALDVEIGESPGIAIEGERMTRFLNVEAGQPYKFTVTARSDAPGLYYVTVIAKVSTQVQTQGRAFSVPVVIGTPPAAQKTEPQKDASGQPVESMPAKEQ
ncbi:MAG TPA: hypothetical protein VFI92_03405 [Steroidobacteraceae bacterium]|nr:hypothetical protein [Steroidobacteraceae bacterium]